jgi:hypothetical protein
VSVNHGAAPLNSSDLEPDLLLSPDQRFSSDFPNGAVKNASDGRKKSTLLYPVYALLGADAAYVHVSRERELMYSVAGVHFEHYYDYQKALSDAAAALETYQKKPKGSVNPLTGVRYLLTPLAPFSCPIFSDVSTGLSIQPVPSFTTGEMRLTYIKVGQVL